MINNMLPDYIYVLCIYCRSKVLQIPKELEGVVCDCGSEIKNPYYRGE